MNQRRSYRIWNQLVLAALVLFVAASAICTVAASAESKEFASNLASAYAPGRAHFAASAVARAGK